jgi:non-specific serine/threonine protein kinase
MSICANLRRRILSRPEGARPIRILLATAVAGSTAAAAASAAQAPEWRRGATMPVPRGEVAATVLRGEIVVVGGFVADGRNSARVDAYSPRTDRWRRLPDLPASVDHAMAAAYRGRLYVAGGYGVARERRTAAYVLERGRWRSLTPMPEGRAAAGAAVVGTRLYVVGGVGPNGLARRALAYDLRRGRWLSFPGPTPREHLAVTAAGGRIYALAGRRAGIDTNVTAFESYRPNARGWTRLPPVPDPRGGTAAAALAGQIVSAGGEEPQGTIAEVFSFDLRTRRWRRLPDLPTPRHGLGVVAANGRVYVVAGGREPGLAVSGVNEFLPLAR